MSQPVTFEPGIHYVLHGKNYEVIQILSDGILIAKDLATNAHISQQVTQLWQQWQAQNLEFTPPVTNLHPDAGAHLPTAFANLADLPPRLQDITWHRYQLIRPLMALPSRARTRQVVESRIQEYLSSLDPSLTSPRSQQAQDTASNAQASSHQESTTIQRSPTRNPDASQEQASSQPLAPLFDITPRTVARWIRRYHINHDIRSLVPSYQARGPQQSRLTPLLQTFLQQAIKETYLTNVRAPVTHVINAFHHLIASENATRTPEQHLKVPGRMTVYRAIAQLDAAETDTARLGRAQAQRLHHQTQQGPLCTRPNQRAELDFAHLDLMVVDATDRLPIGRPTIAAIRDKYTGYLLGIFISFEPPSYRVAMECMLYAFLPKEHVKAQFQHHPELWVKESPAKKRVKG